ncbi:uncharacterized protein LOC111919274 isoform X2 [Lactuca sativa]|uniref:uncharacterized protein LOC111919274 isoform X2 n=1 Tax=Lactuca sativa TaxID=4236 RepID=UPI001C6908CB|nr:uncharacterized protein LOC111919274 isoform X2 [Lactuca sativa]
MLSLLFFIFLTDMDSIHEYNWAKFLLDKLVREFARFRQGKQRAVGGCLLFLQLFYYESLAIGVPGELGPVVIPCLSELGLIVIPCLSSWTEENISEREKQEKELGGYRSGEVIFKERGLGVHVDTLPDSHRAYLSLAPQEEHQHLEGGGVSVVMNYKDQVTLPTKIKAFGYNNNVNVSMSVNNNNNNNTMDYDQNNGIGIRVGIAYYQNQCPVPNCTFNGQYENLSDHFSKPFQVIYQMLRMLLNLTSSNRLGIVYVKVGFSNGCVTDFVRPTLTITKLTLTQIAFSRTYIGCHLYRCRKQHIFSRER